MQECGYDLLSNLVLICSKIFKFFVTKEWKLFHNLLEGFKMFHYSRVCTSYMVAFTPCWWEAITSKLWIMLMAWKAYATNYSHLLAILRLRYRLIKINFKYDNTFAKYILLEVLRMNTQAELQLTVIWSYKEINDKLKNHISQNITTMNINYVLNLRV